jgi:uncharacterized membrane protein YgdD (TMEM256/DUF423 family)
MDRVFLFLGSCAALTGVAFGAWGSHGLQGKISPPVMAIYATGVQYHLIHALGLIALGSVIHWISNSMLLKIAGGLFFLGILLFSGSLYAFAITNLQLMKHLTPFGGMAFMLGWLFFAVGVLKK